ncbi:hypothetical protein MKZ38_007664 [Zalerion maritima]|uniref:Pre-rRNA processing protein n=1 Tax=Zalerion maritima TaxID=339359 RepID=A0AAD5S6F4_9PEZI|nr:hypothetical protein MKZ38_007664 [Zalerion maritima]
MADDEASPLLTSDASPRAEETASSGPLLESTPLLSDSSSTPRYDGTEDTREYTASVLSAASSRSSQRSKSSKHGTRRISYIAMFILAVLMIAIMILAFILPDAVQEYAKEAAVLEPTNLSIEEITMNGVRARVQANFRLDANRVGNNAVRRVGRAVTWVVREVGNEETEVNVYLPEYDGVLLGTATVPPLAFKLRGGKTTTVDFVTDIKPGDAEGYRGIVNQWLDGKLHELRLQAKAQVPIRSGILPLGTHAISESLVFEGQSLYRSFSSLFFTKKVPSLPKYNITRINVHDVPVPGEDKMQLGADVTITAFNKYPVSLYFPKLAFELLVPSCQPYDQILVAAALTSPVEVHANSDVELNVRGIVKEIPKSLVRVCPHSESSPLDMFLDHYMHGEDATVYVRGGKQLSVPDWVGDILSSITVPIPFPGHNFDSILKEFSLTDVDFTLPDPFAEPGDPNADPKVSGTILVTAAIPSEMNFQVNVTNIRATSDVFYRKKKFGELNVRDWQPANSTETKVSELKIQSRITDAPLNIINSDVFSEVVQEVLFGNDKLMLDIKALVDVKVETVLGQLVLKDVPAEGKIPVKRLPRSLPGGPLDGLDPQVGDVKIIDTTKNSVTIQALVNVTNPTPYTATIPYVNIHVLCNNSIVGEATARGLKMKRGNNTNVLVEATWDPSMGGGDGPRVGRNLISQYLSGWNTTLTIKAHRNSIPSAPVLGEALSHLNITVDTPKLQLPGETEDDKSRFIRDATFHIFSSTASFTLVSPLQHNTLYITSVNATAYYNHTDPVGHIKHDLPFEAPPGVSETPKLPVDWSMGSVGYDALKKALGSQLKLDAFAIVGVRVDSWVETVWYQGKGIGAHIRM